MSAQTLIAGTAKISGVAIAWVLLFDLNQYAFAQLEYSSRAHWVFLPAALRIIFVLLFGWLGAIGLMVGAYFTLPDSLMSFQFTNFLLAASSGVAPLLALFYCRRFFKVNPDLSELRGAHVVVLSIVCAAANSVVLSMYFATQEDVRFVIEQGISIFVGDSLGSAIVLSVISIGASIAVKLNQRKES